MNDIESIYQSLLDRPETTESFPFGPEAAVYKVADKVFAIFIPDEVPPRLNLKCDPDRAIELRATHDAIIPGYHMNKRHWNTVELDGSVDDKLVIELIDHSYALVVAGLPKKVRERLG
ncbi:MAG: MmcQ/YjbR family DNA-binding protein [Verrucomicrobiota bacterium]